MSNYVQLFKATSSLPAHLLNSKLMQLLQLCLDLLANALTLPMIKDLLCLCARATSRPGQWDAAGPASVLTPDHSQLQC